MSDLEYAFLLSTQKPQQETSPQNKQKIAYYCLIEIYRILKVTPIRGNVSFHFLV